jgi:Zn-dependent membrane protease YugP
MIESLSDFEYDVTRKAEICGAELARRVIASCGTSDVFDLARQACVRVVYERWPLVTVGEYDPRAATIRVNLAALEQSRQRNEAGAAWPSPEMLARMIVAHELGHLIDAREHSASSRNRKRDAVHELIAHAFARSLLGMPASPSCYEKIWQSV